MAGLYAPLPTLRRRPRGRLRTDRGRRGLLLLHRSGLSPHTPCRSPGALTLALPRYPLVSRGDERTKQVRQRLRAEVGTPEIEHYPAGHLPVLEERWREVEPLVADAEPPRRLFRIE